MEDPKVTSGKLDPRAILDHLEKLAREGKKASLVLLGDKDWLELKVLRERLGLRVPLAQLDAKEQLAPKALEVLREKKATLVKPNYRLNKQS